MCKKSIVANVISLLNNSSLIALNTLNMSFNKNLCLFNLCLAHSARCYICYNTSYDMARCFITCNRDNVQYFTGQFCVILVYHQKDFNSLRVVARVLSANKGVGSFASEFTHLELLETVPSTDFKIATSRDPFPTSSHRGLLTVG